MALGAAAAAAALSRQLFCGLRPRQPQHLAHLRQQHAVTGRRRRDADSNGAGGSSGSGLICGRGRAGATTREGCCCEPPTSPSAAAATPAGPGHRRARGQANGRGGMPCAPQCGGCGGACSTRAHLANIADVAGHRSWGCLSREEAGGALLACCRAQCASQACCCAPHLGQLLQAAPQIRVVPEARRRLLGGLAEPSLHLRLLLLTLWPCDLDGSRGGTGLGVPGTACHAGRAVAGCLPLQVPAQSSARQRVLSSSTTTTPAAALAPAAESGGTRHGSGSSSSTRCTAAVMQAGGRQLLAAGRALRALRCCVCGQVRVAAVGSRQALVPLAAAAWHNCVTMAGQPVILHARVAAAAAKTMRLRRHSPVHELCTMHRVTWLHRLARRAHRLVRGVRCSSFSTT